MAELLTMHFREGVSPQGTSAVVEGPVVLIPPSKPLFLLSTCLHFPSPSLLVSHLFSLLFEN